MFPLDKKIKLINSLGLFFIIVSSIVTSCALISIFFTKDFAEILDKNFIPSDPMTRFLQENLMLWNYLYLIHALCCLLAFVFLLKAIRWAKLVFKMLIPLQIFSLVLFVLFVLYPVPEPSEISECFPEYLGPMRGVTSFGSVVWEVVELGIFIWMFRQLKDKKLIKALKRGANG